MFVKDCGIDKGWAVVKLLFYISLDGWRDAVTATAYARSRLLTIA